MWDVRLFYSRAVIQRTIVDLLAFLEHGLAETIAICAQTNRSEQARGWIHF
jgi:hypothetical protein